MRVAVSYRKVPKIGLANIRKMNKTKILYR